MQATTPPPKEAITALFNECRRENRAALILFLTSGFPNKEISAKVLNRVAEAGADLIELGVPFSDPIADGPIIQKASTAALNAGMSLEGTLQLAATFRTRHQAPLILFGALNPFLQMGYDTLAKKAVEVGANGVLAADLPIEEAEELESALDEHGLGLIPLIAPTTPDGRLALFAKRRYPFVYCISYKGTTGTKEIGGDELSRYLARVRQTIADPLCVGFGIKTAADVKTASAAGADGVIIGSALVKLIGEAHEAGRDPVQEAGKYVEGLVASLKRG